MDLSLGLLSIVLHLDLKQICVAGSSLYGYGKRRRKGILWVMSECSWL